MTRRLIDISEDLIALETLLYETGGDITSEEAEAALDEWFSTLAEERDTKLDSYAGLITELEARADVRKNESKRLRDRAKVDENIAQKLKDRLVYFFAQFDLKTIETDRYRLTRARAGGKQPVRVKVSAEDLPAQFQRVKTTVSADKNAILEAIEAGEDVSEYAELEERSEYLKIS